MSLFIQTLAGSSETNSTPRGLTSSVKITVEGLFKLGGNETIPDGLEEVMEVEVGIYIERRREPGSNQVLQAILAMEDLTPILLSSEAVAIMTFIKSIAYDAGLTVVANCPRRVSRQCMLDILDDVLVFNELGMAYFGPADRLKPYLAHVGFPVPQDVHTSDHIFELMADYEVKGGRQLTDTAPAVRYQYSLIREYVKAIANQYTEAPDEDEIRRLPNVQRGRNQPLTAAEEILVQQQVLADMEAEAERQRIAESEAENMWKALSSDDPNYQTPRRSSIPMKDLKAMFEGDT